MPKRLGGCSKQNSDPVLSGEIYFFCKRVWCIQSIKTDVIKYANVDSAIEST